MTEKHEKIVNSDVRIPSDKFLDRLSNVIVDGVRFSKDLKALTLEAEGQNLIGWIDLKAIANQFPAQIKKVQQLLEKILSTKSNIRRELS